MKSPGLDFHGAPASEIFASMCFFAPGLLRTVTTQFLPVAPL